jgi:tetratricopeptide (TPR) repeat protein
MNRPKRVAAIASVLLVACLAGSVALLSHIDRIRPTATLEEVLYLPSPNVLKRLSLGYDGLLADIYWTRAVQYYGATHRDGGGRYQLLWPLLNITAHLDPHLTQAYEFGGAFLSAKPPNGAGLPDRAIELVEYGIRENPNDWHLYYDLGFIHYDLKDYRGAANAFLRGSRLPNAHPVLAILAARMAEHGGELQTARILWKATYQTSNDKDIRANALTHLRALQADDDVIQLERLVETYRKRFGHYPASFQEVSQAGLLGGIPIDPAGHPYKIEAKGKVQVSNPDDLPFLEKGLPPGYVPKDVIEGAKK